MAYAAASRAQGLLDSVARSTSRMSNAGASAPSSPTAAYAPYPPPAVAASPAMNVTSSQLFYGNVQNVSFSR